MSDRTDDLQDTQEDTIMSFCNIRSFLLVEVGQKETEDYGNEMFGPVQWLRRRNGQDYMEPEE